VILNFTRIEHELEKHNINKEKFYYSKEEYVFQGMGMVSEYLVEDNFKHLTYNFGSNIRGEIEFFEPSIFMLKKGSRYYNKQVAKDYSFGIFNKILRAEMTDNKWCDNKGDYSITLKNICFYSPSGFSNFISGNTIKYQENNFLGVDNSALPLLKKFTVKKIHCQKNLWRTTEKEEKELEEIKKNINLKDTEKEELYTSRIGQGKFRKDLLNHLNNKCVVSGIAASELLIASHIVPWSESTNYERLDKFNGLLLSASIDKLFDTHLISFDDDGYMLISKKLQEKYVDYKEIMIKIGVCEKIINRKKSIDFHETTKQYLKKHASKIKNL